MHICVPAATIHGELMCGGGGNIRIHVYLQLLYTVHCTQCTVHGELTCGGGIHVWELLTCAGDIHVWELLTCETSHQSEILHSLIFSTFIGSEICCKDVELKFL